MILEIYDIRCFKNIFTYNSYCPKENKFYHFIICDWSNDTESLLMHLSRDKLYHVSFGGFNFGYPLLHFIIQMWQKYPYGMSFAKELYEMSKELLLKDFNAIPDNKTYIKQIDLFRINYFYNVKRSASLDDIKFNINYPIIRACPFEPDTLISQEQAEEIFKYEEENLNTIFELFKMTMGKTEHHAYKNINKIQIREDLQKKFKVNCMNYGDVPIGEKLLLNLYSRNSGITIPNLVSNGTHKASVELKDCVPYWFKPKYFSGFLESLNNTVVRVGREDEDFSYSTVFKGIALNMGLGGIHSVSKKGIYVSDEEYIVCDFDVESMYASIICALNLKPEHLDPLFNDIYKPFYIDRINEKHKPKEEQNISLIKSYKYILNGVPGKCKEEKSFLYDTQLNYKIVIGGQTLTCMWLEKLYDACNEIEFIAVNTDGIVIRIPRKDLNNVLEVNKTLSTEIGFSLEENYYDKLIMKDVSSYIAINDSVKLRGDFEIDKELFKDSSMKIVPIALKEYYLNNIPIEDTIKNHNNIYDFCLKLKCRNDSKAILKYINDKGEICYKSLDKTTRYYVSTPKEGINVLFKKTKSGNESGVSLGANIKIFNEYEQRNMEDYNIDYLFYIREANKIKNAVSIGQLTLF